MMKILHVLKSEPDELIQKMITLMSEGTQNEVVKLYDDTIDYGDLIDRIFSHDKVFSW